MMYLKFREYLSGSGLCNIIIVSAVGLFLLTAMPGCSTLGCLQSLYIVNEERQNASIMLLTGASNQMQTAAKDLQTYIEKASSAKLPIVIADHFHPSNGEHVKIWLVKGLDLQGAVHLVTGLDGDGFVVSSLNKTNIVITSPSDWGVEFGVYEFLERYVGVRWLFPGPLGEIVPRTRTITVPIKTRIRQNPAFISRQLSGLGGEVQEIWARRNRMHGTIQFHHNMGSLLPAERHFDKHPEFYPLNRGKRVFPRHSKRNWQPCFSAEGSAEEAANNIITYFEQDPEKTSFSLGVNDGGGYCQCSKCIGAKPASGDIHNSQSDLYYFWANRIAEAVSRRYPDRWLGCLAYSKVHDAPAFQLHPRIMPYITGDRFRWIDPKIEADEKSLNELWRKQASVLGWYDYVNGTPYLVPRVYFHQMGRTYQYAHSIGTTGFYAEAYPNWGEGPKLYLTLKLLWDPKLKVDAVLWDWYVNAVGKEAAPFLASYYELWEMFWTQRVPYTDWFKRGASRKEPDYLDALTREDIIRSRELLETVLAKTETLEQRERASMLLRAFEYYESSALSYLGLQRGEIQPGKNIDSKMARKRYKLVEDFETDVLLKHPIRFDKGERFKMLNW